MSVKGNKSGTRLLALLECIARHQPIGVSEIARLTKTDKSTVQRAIMTLVEGGWVRAAPGTPTRWQLTGHILHVAHMAHGSSGLLQRARPALEALRDASGETICLSVPDIEGFVLIEVIESQQPLRMVPAVGIVIPGGESATGHAVLPYLPHAEQMKLLGGAFYPGLDKILNMTLRRGYAVNQDDRAGGSINVAAPIFELDGQPAGAVVLCAPKGRLLPEHYAQVGAMVVQTARQLSLAPPRTKPQTLASQERKARASA
jgi:IclR family transcriptional regulator, acetate operon repressor